MTILLAKRWRCRPSEADEEPALWVLRQQLFDSYESYYTRLNSLDFEDDD